MPQRSSKLITPNSCPVCSQEVPRNALACPECGADHNSGWREGASIYDGLDLPEDPVDWLSNANQPTGIHPIWWITALLIVAAMLFSFLS